MSLHNAFLSRACRPWAAAAVATLLVACGGGGDSATPPARQPVAITMSGLPAMPMIPGQSAALAASIAYSDASTQDVTASATWSTNAAAVLSVSPGGTITALAPGEADVVAAAQGLSARRTVLVETPRAPLAPFAGSLGGAGHVDGIGAIARFSAPTGIAVDSAGNAYVADTGNEVIRRITPSGGTSTVAGAPGMAGSSDGPAADARFRQPVGVAIDTGGNLYVADTGNHTIRRIAPDGRVETLAGAAGSPGSSDGNGAVARFRSPQGVTVDAAGNVYVADTGNYTVRRVTPAGKVSTVAGAPGIVGNADGPGSDARFGACRPLLYGGGEDCWGPTAIALDRSGSVLVADAGNFTVRAISLSNGIVSTLPGSFYGCTQGMLGASRCIGPTGVAGDDGGGVHVVVANSRSLYRIAPDGAATRVAGVFEDTGSTAQFFNSAGGVAVDRAGNVYVPDTNSHTIRRLSAAGGAATLAGSALWYGSADGGGEQARFGACIFVISVIRDCLGPTSVAIDSDGFVVVSDRQNDTLRRISAAGVVGTLAGQPGQYGSADGSLQEARFFLPTAVAADEAGTLYVSDANNHTIRRISADGRVTTLAGKPGQSGSSDGTGSQARFSNPGGVATDSAGTLYVADSGNSTIRRVSAAGFVSTFAGEAGQRGSDDGTGAQARFDLAASGLQWRGSSGLATDGAGNVYVADTNNHTVRRITPDRVVTTIAGSPGQPGSTDGTGPAARFSGPQGVATDGDGNVYVADTGNHTIRRIGPDARVTTIVGVAGRRGFVAGPLPGGLTSPLAVAVSGHALYIVMPNGIAVASTRP